MNAASPQTLRIIHHAPTYFHPRSIIGGGERYVLELARFQQKEGHHVRIVSYDRSPNEAPDQLEGVPLQVLQSRHGFGFDLVNPFSLPRPGIIRSAEVIHVHQLCTWVSDLSALTAATRRQVLVGTDHGGGGYRVLNRRLQVYPRYHAVTGQSSLAFEQLTPHFTGRTHLVPGGVDMEQFRPGKPASPPTILFVGRMLPHKGIHLLIEAFRRARLEGWALRLLGPEGDPAYRRDLEQRAQGLPVTFVHDADNAEVVRAYQAARMVVLPSGRMASRQPPELMGFTVLEAQACGVPVVVSDAGPMGEFIKEGSTGFTFPAGDEMALADRLRRASTLPPGTAEACRRHVLAFSWQSVARRMLNLYQSLMKRHD